MKHNWKALKTAYVTGEIKTVSEFARVNGIPQNTISKHAKGWVEDKARFMQKVCTRIEEKAVSEKVLSAEKRKEYLSEYIRGTVEQWKRLKSKIIEVEEAMQGQPPNMRMLQELRRVFNADTKILPDLLRAMELLEGGATSRTDTVIGGKRTKDMSEQELHDTEEELAREVLEKKEKVDSEDE